MPLRSHLSAILNAALVLTASALSDPLCAAQQPLTPGNGSASPLQHGSTEVLVEKLVREREIEGFLSDSVLERDGRLSETAIEALSQIFSHPVDVFDIDPKTGTPQSIRGQAMMILREASPSVQRAWMTTTAPIADVRLRAAMTSADFELLRSVALRFPMTESGIDAAVLLLTRDYLRHGSGGVRLEADQLRQWYHGTILEKFTNSRLQRLLQLPQPVAVDEKLGGGVRLSVATSADDGQLAPPWPRPLWEWHEYIWNYPGAPQPAAGTTLESFEPRLDSNLPEFSNWRPVFWDGNLLLRTPFRLIAFDRRTGRDKWSIPTQTFSPDANDGDADHDDSLTRQNPEPSSIGGLAAFGLMSADDEFLYFIDQFDFFRSEASFGGYRSRPFIAFPNLDDDPDFGPQPVATRLVALRRSKVGRMPAVAWIAGDAGSFKYEPVPEGKALKPHEFDFSEAELENSDVENATGEGLMLEVREDDGPGVADRKLDGHRFVAPPVGRDSSLFVLSVGKDQFWLNRLDRGTGRVVWQQPLIFSDETLTHMVNSWNHAASTSICLLSGDTVVCALADGVLVGVSSTDGQLRWATAIRDQPVAPPLRGFGLPLLDEPEGVDTTAAVIPVANDGIMVCSGSRSGVINGIDTKTGDILWQTSRRAFGAGDVGDSPDHYIAGISGSQVMLVGERHCRSLDLKSGVQNWVLEISRTSGRAECREGRCLIPLCDGGILTIDLSSGQPIRRQTILPFNTDLQFGAVTSDADILCTSTPVSVVVFPRVDAVLEQFRQAPASERLSAVGILEQAQAHLINGDLNSAFELLRTSAATAGAEGQPTENAPLEIALGELILREWGELIAAQTEVPTHELTAANAGIPVAERLGHMNELTVANAVRTMEQAGMLADLALTTEQQLRAAVFAVLSRENQRPLRQDAIAELAAFKEWTTPVAVTDVWSVRPDILLERAAPAAATSILDTSDISLWQLQKSAVTSVLFPDMIRDDAARKQLATALISRGEHAAAELFLLSWHQAAAASRHDITVAEDLLQRLRSLDVIAGYEPDRGRRHFWSENTAGSGEPFQGLSSKTRKPLILDVTPFMKLPSSEWQNLEKGEMLNSLPAWSRMKYSFVDGSSGHPDLISLDPTDGSIRDRVPIPFSHGRSEITFHPLENGTFAPGLVPIAGPNQLAMLSCTVPGRARLLWQRNYHRSAPFDTGIQFGPLGADHFVWHFGDRLHCSHPLTGEDLWTRRLKLSRGEMQSPSLRRIFGDRNATVVMGSDASSFQRFSTRDGHLLGQGRLTISSDSEMAVTGRFLLYPDMNSRLHVFDGATGHDVLENDVPIVLQDDEPIVLGRHNPVRMFSVLPEGRVVTVSLKREIVLVDTLAGNVAFRTPTTGILNTGPVIGVTAFDRNGKLFVGLDDEGGNSGRIADGFTRSGEPSLGFGPLFCLNPQTGVIEWSAVMERAVIPRIYGDPTDLLVVWKQPQSADNVRSEESVDLLNVQLIDGTTGRVIAKASSLSTAPPFRCVHIAAENMIQLYSRDAVISFSTEPQPLDVP